MNTPAEIRPLSPLMPLAASILFAVALTQPPVFYSNQNQYFLHGLASSGFADLSSDWLANTKDSTPVFSWAVSVLYPLTGAMGVYAGFFVMSMVYFLSLWAIIATLPGKPVTTAGRWTFAAAMIGLHSGIIRWGSVYLFGVDYPWFFQAGVANQYILGAGLQPSVFGVFLLTAIAFFAHGRNVAAGMMIALACTLHSTYLLPGALLVTGMMVRLAVSQGIGKAIRFGLIVLLGVLPVTVAAAVVFRPTDSATFEEGQRILAWVRIPHHCDAARWIDLIAWLQIAWAGLGIVALWRSNLTLAIGIAVSLATGLSIVQILTHNTSLALLFPWRLSAVIVPVATAVLLARLTAGLEKLPGVFIGLCSFVVIAVAVVGAERVHSKNLGYQVSAAEDGLQLFVNANRQPGDVYLLPAGFPKPPAKPGSASASFVPVSQTGRPAMFELQRFRLIAGAAAYVDFKSIPYADIEVIEWQNRVKTVVRWYATPDWDSSGVLDEVRVAGITHVVVPDGVNVASSHLKQVYGDPAYRVFRIE
ncbi:DUF6798 domain-containing protein [Zavarzinella formosa]|uniref:DUF6798 domain-containing protein n=1 Tax=Zavarzinella formosa TaxID=360055 RepID=UPI0002DB8DC5|nr:DUF6798 domain-containing protein [Zavarzinella formosa]